MRQSQKQSQMCETKGDHPWAKEEMPAMLLEGMGGGGGGVSWIS